MLVNLLTVDIIIFPSQLQVQMLLELIYQLMPPLETSGQHLKLVTAKKKIIMRQRRYMTQLASIFALLVQVRGIFSGPLREDLWMLAEVHIFP